MNNFPHASTSTTAHSSLDNATNTRKLTLSITSIIFILFFGACSSKSEPTGKPPRIHKIQKQPLKSNQKIILGQVFTLPFTLKTSMGYLDGGTLCSELRDAKGKPLSICLDNRIGTSTPHKLYIGGHPSSETAVLADDPSDETILIYTLRSALSSSDFEDELAQSILTHYEKRMGW